MYIQNALYMYICIVEALGISGPKWTVRKLWFLIGLEVAIEPRAFQQYSPEGPSTQYLRTLVPKAIPLMVFGTRVVEYWVIGPAGQ